MAEPYMPSNGSEGEGFFESFCAHCSRDAAFRATGYEGDGALGCQILAASYRGEQQAEWISDERGSRCTAYTTDPTMPVRSDQRRLVMAKISKKVHQRARILKVEDVAGWILIVKDDDVQDWCIGWLDPFASKKSALAWAARNGWQKPYQAVRGRITVNQ